jgi:uncharacterized membrane protein YhaH (DUF805 family)
VQGSLDDPPIVIHAVVWRRRQLLRSLGVLFWALFFVGQAFEPIRKHDQFMFATIALGLIAFVARLVFGAWALIVPPTLELTATHLVERVAWSRRRWPWNKVRNFRIVTWDREAALTFDRAGWSWFGLADPTMPPTERISLSFEIETEALTKLLNEAHDRWAGEVASSRDETQSPRLLRAAAAHAAKLSAGGMTRPRFWVSAGIVVVGVAASLLFEGSAFLASIVTAFGCFAISRARLRDIGWPPAYGFVLLTTAAYGLVISFMFSSRWASSISAAVVIAAMIPLGFIRSAQGLKVYGSLREL